ASTASTASTELTTADLSTIAQLQQRDREVRAHEQAHISAGGGLITSGASFTYQTGPDNKRYAIGGEVGIDTSPGRTPEETLDRAARIRAAALAPADPSAQDRQVAAAADRMAMEARMEVNLARSENQAAPDRREAALARLVASVSANSGPGTTINTYA
ncbi:MAG: hypothetical protein CVU28_01240, partial [Betaproteobacteria bacterium HGW-Betaproteobacteria-21]